MRIFILDAVPLIFPMLLLRSLHDKLQGHVSAPYAYETFAKNGDLKGEAQEFLRQGVTP